MICPKTQYSSINRILLLAVGIWPYQQTNFVRLQYIFLSGILTTATIFQFTTFMTSRYTPNILKILPNTLGFTMFVILYNWFRFNIEIVKNLLEQMLHICNNIKDDNEIAIIERYDYNAKCFTVILTILVFSCVPVFIIIQVWPIVIDVELAETINISRLHHLAIMTEYFVDEDKYFHLILFHIMVAFCIGGIAMLAIGTMFLTYFHHICGMFTIASYRIENAMRINMLKNSTNENLLFERIICAVDIHRQSMKLATIILSVFEIPFMYLAMFGVIFLSLNLLRIFQIASNGDNVKELFLPILFVIIDILYLFIANYIGQDITDHNRHIFATVYDSQWYVAPLHVQRLILFLLQRGTKDFTLSIGGLFVASIQCFATLMNASVSYFTVFCSTQH